MMRPHLHIKKLIVLAIIVGLILLLYPNFVAGFLQMEAGEQKPASQGKIVALTIDGAISPANADYFSRGLEHAIQNNADILLLNLNTPGGLDKSMRQMIQAILDSPIPVVIYVSPKGSRAASAGTYLIYASHIAAMAPATNLGSATPVSIGIMKPAPTKPQNQPEKEKTDTDSDKADEPLVAPLLPEAMQHKMVNDAKAYIRSLAQLRGRNQEWAVAAVEKADNLSAEEALAKNVVELIAYDQEQLIEQLNQRQVKVADKTIKLSLIKPEIIQYQPDWRTDLLIVLTDPSIAYLLLLAGVYGLMFEFIHPGSILPGTVGAICLLVALYALNMLPINLAGLALLLLGVMLMVGEAFAPSFGILGIGGISAFMIGSFMLMDSSLPGYQIAPSLIIASSLMSGLIIILVLNMVLKVRRQPLSSGKDELINHLATALENFDGDGRVIIRGEIWRAKSDCPVSKGQKVRVLAIKGLTLTITGEIES